MAQTIPQQETALQVKSKPPVIVFDFEAAKAAVKASLEKYNGLVVSEDTTVEIKKDMADLNKQKAALADAAKEAVKAISDPLDAFNGQVKELTSLFEETYKSLGEKVKFFEDKQREERRKLVEEVIKKAMEQEEVSFEIPIQDKWLNKGASVITIKDAVYDIIDKYKAAEAQKKALEQAKQDRVAAIEAHVKALNEKHGLSLSISRFIGNSSFGLDVPLTAAIAKIEEDFSIELKLREAEESAKKALSSMQPAPAPVPTPTPEPAQEQPETQPITEPLRTISWSSPAQAAPAPATTTGNVSMIVVLEYLPTNGKSVTALLDVLEKQCVTFSKRIKNQ